MQPVFRLPQPDEVWRGTRGEVRRLCYRFSGNPRLPNGRTSTGRIVNPTELENCLPRLTSSWVFAVFCASQRVPFPGVGVERLRSGLAEPRAATSLARQAQREKQGSGSQSCSLSRRRTFQPVASCQLPPSSPWRPGKPGCLAVPSSRRRRPRRLPSTSVTSRTFHSMHRRASIERGRHQTDWLSHRSATRQSFSFSRFFPDRDPPPSIRLG